MVCHFGCQGPDIGHFDDGNSGSEPFWSHDWRFTALFALKYGDHFISTERNAWLEWQET
jgi:hypothetical protein